jgi:hypothetical protein
MAEKIDVRYLEGLTYSGSGPKEQKQENGGKKTVYVPFERAATPDDVADWKDKGDSISVVMKDGKKYTVAKKAAKK